MSITTEIISDSSVNCDKAIQVGQVAIAKMIGNKYAEVILHCEDKVKSLSAMKNSPGPWRGHSC